MSTKDGPEIVNVINSITDEQLSDSNLKEELHAAARRLLFRTESAHDLTNRIYYGVTPLSLAKLGVDLGVFKIFAKDPKQYRTPANIADQVGCDEQLLVRILRGLAAYGLVAQNNDGTYSSNGASELFSQDNVAAGVNHNHDNVVPVVRTLPEFLKASKYVEPSDAAHSPFHMAFNTTLAAFEFVGRDPYRLAAVLGFMQIQRMGQKSWIEQSLVPAEYFIMSDEDVKSGRAVFVDVGGGAGHQAIALRQSQPNLRGEVVVQDRPEVVGSIDRPKMKQLGVEFMAHDFETPQVVIGAKVYYMRNVLHDWTDPVCHSILSCLRTAMKSDSRIMIDEMVVREIGSNWKQVNIDVAMMGAVAAKERTELEWKKMLELANLKIEKIVEYDAQTGDSLIIAAPVA